MIKGNAKMTTMPNIALRDSAIAPLSFYVIGDPEKY